LSSTGLVPKRPISPADSSTKSTGGSKRSRAAANSAADKAFLRQASSPYDEAAPATGPEDGRTRLRGAFLIACDRIRRDPTQVRRTIRSETVKELAQSIREVGILQPIAVRYDATDDIYIVISGERRFRAAQVAGLVEVPCLVREPGQDRLLLHQVTENWQRENVEPTELGRALAALQETYQYTLDDLARLTGKGKGDISKHLAIAGRVDPAVQAAAQSDPQTLTKRHLYSLSKLAPKEQRSVAEKIQAGHLNANDTEELVEQTRLRTAGVRPDSPPATTIRRFDTHHGLVTVRTKQGRRNADHILAALDEAKRQLLDSRD
jgi:ParB family chromosome partitioning protein